MNAGYIDFCRSDLHSKYTARIMNEVTYTYSDPSITPQQYESALVLSSGSKDGWKDVGSDKHNSSAPNQYGISPFKLKVLGNVEC
jgi:hypothetical protein